MGMTSFREVLEKMLVIVVLPVRKSLRKEVELFSPHLVSNTCGLLASIVSELTASALGSEVVCTRLTPIRSCTDAHKDINKTVILLFSIALLIKRSHCRHCHQCCLSHSFCFFVWLKCLHIVQSVYPHSFLLSYIVIIINLMSFALPHCLSNYHCCLS